MRGRTKTVICMPQYSEHIQVDMERENPHNCPVCGGFDFTKEAGYFYCLECQTQCEDIRELLFEVQGDNENFEDVFIGTSFFTKKARKQKRKRKGDDFTSWEMFNFLLRGQVEELLAAGAPSSLKDTVLQLWAFYLKKLEVAFVSKEERLLPKFSVKYYSEDAKLLNGLKKKKPMKACRVTECSLYAELSSTIPSFGDWSSEQMKKKIKSKAKKALMKKIAESSSLDQSDISEFNGSLSVSSNPWSLPESVSSFSSSKLERTEAAKKWIAKTSKQEDEKCNVHMLDPKHLSRYKLVNLLYLALLFEGSKIQISDLLRWIREGHLSYYEVGKHLPETCFIQGRFSNIVGVTPTFPAYSIFLDSVSYLRIFLQMVDWPVPDVSELAKKYVAELQLPEMFSDLIIRFVALVPLSYKGSRQSGIPNYEGRILAILIIILKLLFGLDGKTEHQISKAASQLNKLLKQKDGYTEDSKLFVWKDWVKQLICRNAVLTRYHFPTKHILYPEFNENPHSYVNYCKNLIDVNAGLQEKFIYGCEDLLKVVQPALLNTFTSILEKLQDPASCQEQDIKFPQCFRPYSVYVRKILEKSAEMDEPLLTKSAEEILTEDFSKCDIMYLLSPQSVAVYAEANGQRVKFKNKSAQKRFKKLPKRNIMTCSPGDYKKQCYVSILNCSKLGKQIEISENSENDEYVQLETGKKKEKKLRVSISEEHKVRTKKKLGKYQMHSKKCNLKEDKKIKSVKNRISEDTCYLAMKPRKKKNQNFSSRNSKKELKRSVLDKSENNRTKKKLEKCQMHSKKSKKITPVKSQNAKYPSDLSKKSRKRRKKESSLRNSKKIKLYKCLKLYVPCSKYWVHIEEGRIDEGMFETVMFRKFPFSFSWLLAECALVSEMSKLTLFKEIHRIEKQCRNVLI